MDDDQARELEALEGILSDASAEPIKLSYGLLKLITENFSNEIGRGGFGVVYEGHLQNGVVAVKKISNAHSNLCDKQFMDEIKCLKSANHKNIVRFLGYCADTQEEIMSFNGEYVMAGKLNRLLCFEYVPNGDIRKYLQQEKPHGDDWPARYQMIRGICEGLQYLHGKKINHLDLKPENVMLDAHMEAKVTDFGLSRFLDNGQSKMITEHVVGTRRYIGKEGIDKGELSFKSDIYALGVIIIELLTGISMISLENWDESLDMDRPRVSRCTEIARNCMDPDRYSRPTIHKVISELDELESMIPWSYINQVTPTAFPGNEMIDVYPLELKFPFMPNQEMCCHLTLTNKTDGVVLVSIPDRYRGRFDGILLPRFTAVITLRREAEEELPSDTEDKLEILMLPTGCHNSSDFKGQLRTLRLDKDASLEDKIKAAHELLGFELHRAMLTAIITASEDDDQDDDLETVHTLTQEEEEEFGRYEGSNIYSMDVHPTEPWVLILGFRKVYIYNWQTKERTGVYAVQETNKKQLHGSFSCNAVVKFIAREQWAVIGSPDGYIRVFMCPTMDQVKEFKAHPRCAVTSLAVHPTRPILLSCSSDHLDFSLKLWDWSNDWSDTGIFDAMKPVMHVMFDPKHASDFSTLHEWGAMTWRIGRSEPIATIKLPGEHYYGAYDFTYTGHRHQIAVTVHPYAATRIFDLQKKKHVHSLYSQGNSTCVVCCHPTRPVLVAALGGVLHVWDSTTFRLKKVYKHLRKKPKHIGFAGLKRLVIGYSWSQIFVMDIDLE